MSGHSKWHNIQARKGKQDSLKAKVFSKFAKTIMLAAKSGGDPDTNFSLRLLLDKARAAGMSKDNIDRAIARGSGNGEGEAELETVWYEAFAPGGAAILVKALTDNKNRTVAEVKYIITAHGGTFAGMGSVAWMFAETGMVHIPMDELAAHKIALDTLELALIDAGADDVREDEEVLEILTTPHHLQPVLAEVKKAGLTPSSSGVEWIAKEKMAVDESHRESLENLFGALEEHDDVEQYWTNAA